ncbi:hypothetical protein F5Y05DRAFT_411145 [Hypoxylon sp. FL0543]|nr:hypothetical protein F5Y05DRAFT_411145 [Hypoxylon sp. FL0543]
MAPQETGPEIEGQGLSHDQLAAGGLTAVEHSAVELTGDSDLIITIYEHDPFYEDDTITKIRSFKVNRAFLAACSPVFKVMLTTEYIESRSPEVILHEDTGASADAMGAVLRALHINHESSSRMPQDELRRERPENGVVYKITPLHILELVWYSHHHHYEKLWCPHNGDTKLCDECCSMSYSHGGHSLTQRGPIKPDVLRWWLDHYSDETTESMRTMKPFQKLVIRNDQIASVIRRMTELIKAQASNAGEEDAATSEEQCMDMMGVALLEEELISSMENCEPYSQKPDANNGPMNYLTATRLQLVDSVHTRTRWKWSQDDNLSNNEIAAAFKQSLSNRAPTHEYNHIDCINPSTYFFLQLDQIEAVIEELSTKILHLRCDWMVTQHLLTEGYVHEHSHPATLEDEHQNAWAYDVQIEEIPGILVALDKYLLPPYTMWRWFEVWFRLKFPGESCEGLEKESVQNLMNLLLAADKFDHAQAFREVTKLLIKAKQAGSPISPLPNPLVLRFPALEGVITPEQSVLDCLNGTLKSSVNLTNFDVAENGGLCLDCIRGSVYPFNKPAEASERLKFWAERHLKNATLKMVSISGKLAWSGGKPYCYRAGCRVEHGEGVLRRCWPNSYPTREYLTRVMVEEVEAALRYQLPEQIAVRVKRNPWGLGCAEERVVE